MNILITGGTGGIGHALIQGYLNAGHQLHATYHVTPPTLTDPNLTWHQCDLTVEHNVAQLASQIPKIDILINTVGMLHRQQQMPEKSITQLDPAFFLSNIHTNVLPTLLLAKHFSPALKGKQTGYFVSLSAKIGSIEDNHLGGWISYRTAKAALNMALKTISIEWQRKRFNTCVIAFHPGTTDTPLSAPFQRNVPAETLRSPEYVADKLITLLAQLTPQQSGRFYSYDGNTLPW